MPKKKSTCRLEIKETGKRAVMVTLYIDGSNITANPRDIEVKNPLSEEDKIDLQWYLEKFLDLATGGNLVRAEKIEKKMKDWGDNIFEQVFLKHPDFDNDPRSLYLKAIERQLRNVEIAVDCRDPYLLSIPWELMKDSENGFIALQTAGFYRQETSVNKPIRKKGTTTGKRPFRILLVISRPKINDIPLSMVAGPMLKAIRNKRDVIEVDLLRPPTFDNLQRTLKEREDYYDLVHFDGHGGFAEGNSGAGGMQRFQVEAGQGVLLFENDDHTPHYVSTNELAEELYGAGVPLFILNACESAKGSDIDPYSSIAANLVKCGARGVVAMSYSVLAVTASYFMERFYERLISGSTLCEAVRDARSRLHSEPFRYPSIGEKVKLEDWIIPVIYQQEEGYIPVKPVKKKKAEEKTAPFSELIINIAEELCPEGKHGFVGRDNDILDIERELTDDDKPWLIITGMSGSGKTDLAYGFARWCSATGGCPGGIFRTDFKSRADLGLIFGSIAGFGTDFSILSEEDQFDTIVRYLKQNRCLLIIDNIETASGYPEGHEPFASQEQLKEMSRFFNALKGGKSRVILTTRKTKEDWPGVASKRMPIGGLERGGSLLMTESILDTIGKRTADFIADHENFEELLRMLKGHPRSLEVVIPLLEIKSPAEIIEALRHGSGDIEDISMNIAFENLSGNARKYLPLAGLFSSWMHMSNFKNMIELKAENIPSMKEIFKDNFDDAEMVNAFDEAARAGLIDKYSEYLFGLHPTFPGFLRKCLISVIGEDGLADLDYIYMMFYGIWSDSIFEGIEKKDPAIMNEVSTEFPNLSRAVRIAQQKKEWEAIHIITKVILEFYDANTRFSKASSFNEGLLSVIGVDLSENDTVDKLRLKISLQITRAYYLTKKLDMDEALKIFNKIENYLKHNKICGFNDVFAFIHQNIGICMQQKKKFKEAKNYYNSAINFYEKVGMKFQIARIYQQLGSLYLEQKSFGKAIRLWNKSIRLYNEISYKFYSLESYHNIGILLWNKEKYKFARKYYEKALYIAKAFNSDIHIAKEFFHLGILDHKCGNLDQANIYYIESLKIYEKKDLRTERADNYYQLGFLRQDQHIYDEAEEWYFKALSISRNLNYYRLQCLALNKLGILKKEIGNTQKAMLFLSEALSIAGKFRIKDIEGLILLSLATLMRDIEEDKFIGIWKEVTGDSEPPMELLRKALAKLEEAEKEE